MRNILTACCLLALVGCASDPYEPRDPDPAKPEPSDETDYSEIIADPTIRAELPGTTLAYGIPGVMYLQHDATYSFIDLDNGIRVDFDALAPSLALDGATLRINSMKTIKNDGTTRWYALDIHFAETDKMAIIVTQSL